MTRKIDDKQKTERENIRSYNFYQDRTPSLKYFIRY